MKFTEENEMIFRKSFPFWDSIAHEDRAKITDSARELFFKSGETVHSAGECSGVFLIKKGGLRVYMLSEDGREITLYRLREKNICMLSASCVIEAITFEVFVDAEEDCECILISPAVYEALGKKYPSVEIFTMNTALERFSDVMWVMQQVLFMSMDRRLAIFIVDELSRTGGDTVKLTHEQIAKHIGSAREVVSRTLKYLANENIVSVSRGEGIKVTDKERLRKLAY